ncbi:MAG: acylphosphatase [Candidatus Omnitrophica bacterium]|jgi:acylphosphatase|nr:acylphosphatase [Candidatus Omnitrophota bacterium]
MRKQAHLYYSGKVQGIGFRFTARKIADTLNVSGWVKNSPDGRVEILAEGEEPDLKNFLSQIHRLLGSYITEESAQWSQPSGDFTDFQVLL